MQLAAQCVAVTTEFENVPADSLKLLAQRVSWRRTPCVSVAQDRIAEKRFFVDCAPKSGVMPAPHKVIASEADIDAIDDDLLPGILKTVRMGYDGKGQVRVRKREDVRAAFASMGQVTCLLEKMLPLAYEVSVLTARGADGESVVYPIAENVHRDGILFTTTVPGPNVSHERAPWPRTRRAPSSPNSATSACCASNSSCWKTARWSSTRWRRVRTTAATTRWTPASPASSRSRCGRWRACRWATCASIRRPSC
jgi:hypothetical protein